MNNKEEFAKANMELSEYVETTTEIAILQLKELEKKQEGESWHYGYACGAYDVLDEINTRYRKVLAAVAKMVANPETKSTISE